GVCACRAAPRKRRAPRKWPSAKASHLDCAHQDAQHCRLDDADRQAVPRVGKGMRWSLLVAIVSGAAAADLSLADGASSGSELRCAGCEIVSARPIHFDQAVAFYARG